MIPPFYYHPRMLTYDFGPQHPLKPERIQLALQLFEGLGELDLRDPGPGDVDDVLRVHDPEYVEAVRVASRRPLSEDDLIWLYPFGLGSGDTPAFQGMYEAALAYGAGSVRAAEDVRDGAHLAFTVTGGLHHARRAQASGFCVFDDPAIACHVLLEKFERVAYVDIDVHHGDGVQWIWYDDPRVLTCSIHEEGRTLYPGTGFVDETGADFTSVNVPLQANTTGDVWLDAFERGILPALEAFGPQAIVLQMGADTHYLDPLAHIQNTVQEWLGAIERIRDLQLPIVAMGGGGYNLTTAPRMWVAAWLTLNHLPIPAHFPEAFGGGTFLDQILPGPRQTGAGYAEEVIERLTKQVHPNIPRSIDTRGKGDVRFPLPPGGEG